MRRTAGGTSAQLELGEGALHIDIGEEDDSDEEEEE